MSNRGLAAVVAALGASAIAACGGRTEPATTPPSAEPELLFRVDGLENPTSVAWDSARGRWLVTAAPGDGKEDGAGYVAAVFPGGDSVVRRAYDSATPELRLDGPRGIVVRGDRAYLADRHRVVAIDLADDHGAFEIRIPGSGRLEDVAVDDRGIIFASDGRGDAVYRVAPDGSGWTSIPAAGSLRRPGGLLVERAEDGRDRLLVAGRQGAVVALNPDSSVALLAGSRTFRELHGIQRSPRGDLVVSDHAAGRLQLVRSRPGRVTRTGVTWLAGLDGPADFLIHGRILALPESGAGRVSFYRLPE